MSAMVELTEIIDADIPLDDRKEKFKRWCKRWVLEGSNESIVDAGDLRNAVDRKSFLARTADRLIQGIVQSVVIMPGAVNLRVVPRASGDLYYMAELTLLAGVPMDEEDPNPPGTPPKVLM